MIRGTIFAGASTSWVMTPELYPTNVRGVGHSWVCDAASPQFPCPCVCTCATNTTCVKERACVCTCAINTTCVREYVRACLCACVTWGALTQPRGTLMLLRYLWYAGQCDGTSRHTTGPVLDQRPFLAACWFVHKCVPGNHHPHLFFFFFYPNILEDTLCWLDFSFYLPC